MDKKFKIPFLSSKKDTLAVDLVTTAKVAAHDANRARTISDFIENYDIVLDSFSKLSRLNKKVSSVKGDLTAEFYRLESEFQKHLHDAIDRSGDEIVSEGKGLYKYDRVHILQQLNQFRDDIDRYSDRFDKQNKEFARAKYSFVSHECNAVSTLDGTENGWDNPEIDELFETAVNVVFETQQASVSMLQRRLKLGYSRAAKIVDQMEQMGIVGPFYGTTPREILIKESEWKTKYLEFLMDTSEVRAKQPHTRSSTFDINQVDCMEGHEFEHWCADVLRGNGFVNVSVTQGSGDQGVDVLATKDGIKYAIQCKCYSSDLGNSPVQEVNTGKVIYHCHVGVFMTNRFFTAGAKEAAEATGILLWDRNKLIDLVKNAKNNPQP